MLVFVVCPDFEKIAALRPEAYQYVIKYPYQGDAYFVQMQPGHAVFETPPQSVPNYVEIIAWDQLDHDAKEWLRDHLFRGFKPIGVMYGSGNAAGSGSIG